MAPAGHRVPPGRLGDSEVAEHAGRALMRALAHSAVLERRAGYGAAATTHVEAYLRAHADTPSAGRWRASGRPCSISREVGTTRLRRSWG